MFDAIRKLDAFSKAQDDFKVQTNSGAVVSLVSIIIMAILFFSELRFYMKTETVDYLYVNTTKTDSLTIDFDLSFPALSCGLLSVDVKDDSGLSQTNVIHEIYKHKLNTFGFKEGEPEKQELGNTVLSEAELDKLIAENKAFVKEKIGSCGNCYGAGYQGQCCNTCDDVKTAYSKMGWQFKPQGIVQCTTEVYINNLKEQYAEEGGCQIFGRLQLSQGTGHFHVAPHRKLHETKPGTGLINLMDLIAFTFDQFNVTHNINSLSFGDQFPGIKSPLDSQSRVLVDTHGMYQYFIKVVPTKYQSLGQQEISSNQYSVTEYMSHLAPGSGRGFPGVYFYYEVSPISAKVVEKEGNLFRFLTSVCAIVGGAYTVFGIVDLLINYILKKQQSNLL